MGMQINPKIITEKISKLGAKTILDVGGYVERNIESNCVLDILPRHKSAPESLRWVQGDVCLPETWELFDENEFDFVICSHVAEDVADPVTLCRGLSRVAKAGYVECPNLYAETMRFSKKEEFLPIEMEVPNGYAHHHHILEPLRPNSQTLRDRRLISPRYHQKGMGQNIDNDIVLMATPKMPWIANANYTDEVGQHREWKSISFFGLFWHNNVSVVIQSAFMDERADTVDYLTRRREEFYNTENLLKESPVYMQDRFISEIGTKGEG